MVTATEKRKGIYGIDTEAFGADPSQIDRVYQFRYRVVDLDEVIPSHNDNLTPHPRYPAEALALLPVITGSYMAE